MARAVLGEVDDVSSHIPKGGCDLTWARLRELEALRGWWNRSKSLDGADRLARTLNPTLSNGAVSTTDTPTAPATSSTSSSCTDLSPSELATAVSRTVTHIQMIWDALPERTAFIVYSGSGDPRPMVRLQSMHADFKKAYSTTKWDELPVKWTDVEEQALKLATLKARSGIGFIGVKQRPE